MYVIVLILQVLLLAAWGADGRRRNRAKRLSESESLILKNISDGGTSFSMDVFNSIFELEQGNMVFSPLSVHLALALLYPAARGDTADLLTRALRLPEEPYHVYKGYKELVNLLRVKSLKIANRIFVDESVNVKQQYKDDLRTYFHSSTQPVKFGRDIAGSVNFINMWVEKVTENKIKHLFSPGSVDSSAKVVLVNAIHFKALWKTQFKVLHTRDHTFHVTRHNHVNVRMMSVEGHFDFHHDTNLKAKIVSMPFKDDQFKMYVILPDEVDGLDAVMENIHIEEAWDINNKLKKKLLSLSLPKFKIESQRSLNDVLIMNGLEPLFYGAPDLSGLSEDAGLVVNQVVQKAVIEVNEEGVEAAAVSGVKVFLRSTRLLYKPTVEFMADHPFLFMIRAIVGTNEVPVFIGSYSRPHKNTENFASGHIHPIDRLFAERQTIFIKSLPFYEG